MTVSPVVPEFRLCFRLEAATRFRMANDLTNHQTKSVDVRVLTLVQRLQTRTLKIINLIIMCVGGSLFPPPDDSSSITDAAPLRLPLLRYPMYRLGRQPAIQIITQNNKIPARFDKLQKNVCSAAALTLVLIVEKN